MVNDKERKNTSFRISLESINKLEELRKYVEDKANEQIPIGIQISKAKLVELLIATEYENVIVGAKKKNISGEEEEE